MALEPIVDYFSFSIPTPMLFRNYLLHIEEGYEFRVDRRTKRVINFLNTCEDLTPHTRGGRFNHHYQSEKYGINFMEGTNAPVSVLQISGRGCAHLRSNDCLTGILEDWHDRATRLDIAVDFASSAEPEVFSRSRSSERFKYGGHESSPTGDTWYVGRQTSDRHARVYRYEPPHPRSDYLRVEYELHDEQAKHTAQSVLELGVYEMALRLGATFGWNHPAYDLPSNVEKARSAPRFEGKANTLLWLHNAVKPAIEKMARGGGLPEIVDIRDWITAIINEVQSEI